MNILWLKSQHYDFGAIFSTLCIIVLGLLLGGTRKKSCFFLKYVSYWKLGVKRSILETKDFYLKVNLKIWKIGIKNFYNTKLQAWKYLIWAPAHRFGGPRTKSHDYVALEEGQEAHWEVAERILFIYGKLNPGQGYVQVGTSVFINTKMCRVFQNTAILGGSHRS